MCGSVCVCVCVFMCSARMISFVVFDDDKTCVFSFFLCTYGHMYCVLILHWDFLAFFDIYLIKKSRGIIAEFYILDIRKSQM